MKECGLGEWSSVLCRVIQISLEGLVWASLSTFALDVALEI
jgi:hypothetical protein